MAELTLNTEVFILKGDAANVFRTCDLTLTKGLRNIDCYRHPHNYYIQWSAETDILKLLTGSLMIGSIVLNCFSYRRFNKDNIFCATAYVFPLAVFFSNTVNRRFLWTVE